jgi:hypothetical protein
VLLFVVRGQDSSALCASQSRSHAAETSSLLLSLSLQRPVLLLQLRQQALVAFLPSAPSVAAAFPSPMNHAFNLA